MSCLLTADMIFFIGTLVIKEGFYLMRFIGNKDSITHEILDLLESKGLTNKKLTLFDAFCGSGAVADALKGNFDIVINDILSWCVFYTKGRIYAHTCTFEKLGFDPFEYLNNSKESIQGFFYENYSPGGSERMYFIPENAGRIDYFRQQIQAWYDSELLTECEHDYLLACLIETVSDVSNTAGVYGAFLKTWDPRAIKPVIFDRVDALNIKPNGVKTFNDKLESIISDVGCDILYLDPPYTQNQYGTQYHLLETLVLNDNPIVSKVTGSRPTTPMRSDWSKEYKTNILFDKIIAETKAKYIVFSYNCDGFMSKDYIESCLKRYGVPDTFICKKISYKKYRNWKTKRTNAHFEYLFFIEKKPIAEVVYDCPLNYIGSKAKMVKEIKQYLPSKSKLVDAFGGGFNVGINLPYEHIIYNEVNYFVTELIESFNKYDTYEYLLYIRQVTKKYKLERENADTYVNARAAYNTNAKIKSDPRFLFTIILYGFQQQIRFNGDHEFNNPIGNRWFNDKVLEKMISFSRRIKECECAFMSRDFRELTQTIDDDTFVYLDPPYRLTCGAYNDGKRGFEGWTNEHEESLFNFIDELTAKNIPVMLSYVLENNGHRNEQLQQWIEQNQYAVKKISTGQGRYQKREEVLILNYATLCN